MAEARDYAATEQDISTTSSNTTSSSHGRFNNDEKRERPSYPGTGLSLRNTVSRRETVLSHIRSRAPIGNFSHPLTHKQTTVEELVDFDGPDDPCRSIDWSLKKKVYTTVLYGFTTMEVLELHRCSRPVSARSQSSLISPTRWQRWD